MCQRRPPNLTNMDQSLTDHGAGCENAQLVSAMNAEDAGTQNHLHSLFQIPMENLEAIFGYPDIDLNDTFAHMAPVGTGAIWVLETALPGVVSWPTASRCRPELLIRQSGSCPLLALGGILQVETCPGRVCQFSICVTKSTCAVKQQIDRVDSICNWGLLLSLNGFKLLHCGGSLCELQSHSSALMWSLGTPIVSVFSSFVNHISGQSYCTYQLKLTYLHYTLFHTSASTNVHRLTGITASH